jgi:hypothetical protein
MDGRTRGFHPLVVPYCCCSPGIELPDLDATFSMGGVDLPDMMVMPSQVCLELGGL